MTIKRTVTVTKSNRAKTFAATVTADMSTLSESMIAQLAEHGLRQKIADSAASTDNHDDAMDAMTKAWEAIKSDEWSTRGTGDGMSTTLAVINFGIRALKDAGDSTLHDRFTGFSAKVPEGGSRSPRDIAKLDWADSNPERVSAWTDIKAEFDAEQAAEKAKRAKQLAALSL